MYSNDLEACGKKCCYCWFHSKITFLTRLWRPFGRILMQFLKIFVRLSVLSAFKLCNFNFYKWEKAYIEYWNAGRILFPRHWFQIDILNFSKIIKVCRQRRKTFLLLYCLFFVIYFFLFFFFPTNCVLRFLCHFSSDFSHIWPVGRL